MAKKLSGFGAAFAAARKSGKTEFDFGGKKFNTKMKGEGTKKSSLPKSVPVPSPRANAVSEMSKKPSFSSMTEAGKSVDKYSKPQSPSKRGGGPPIAMSKANIEKRKAKTSMRSPGRYKLPKV
jgi:hypothetical protein